MYIIYQLFNDTSMVIEIYLQCYFSLLVKTLILTLLTLFQILVTYNYRLLKEGTIISG